MEDGSSRISIEHDGIEFLSTWRTGGGEVEIVDVVTFAFFVG